MNPSLLDHWWTIHSLGQYIYIYIYMWGVSVCVSVYLSNHSQRTGWDTKSILKGNHNRFQLRIFLLRDQLSYQVLKVQSAQLCIHRKRENSGIYVTFPSIWELSEMLIASSMIWTRVYVLILTTNIIKYWLPLLQQIWIVLV